MPAAAADAFGRFDESDVGSTQERAVIALAKRCELLDLFDGFECERGEERFAVDPKFRGAMFFAQLLAGVFAKLFAKGVNVLVFDLEPAGRRVAAVADEQVC